MRGLSVGYRHNANKLNTVVGAEWMVFHSARKYLHQRLLPAITNSLSLSDEDSNHHLHQKKIWTYHFGKFTSIRNCVCLHYCIVSPTSVVLNHLALQHQCCAAAGIALLKFIFNLHVDKTVN